MAHEHDDELLMPPERLPATFLAIAQAARDVVGEPSFRAGLLSTTFLARGL